MAQSHEHYDAVIIGVGQAGNPLATALSQAGRRVAVIERRYVGGTCVNDGCTPTKTMIASGRVAYLARRAADYGVQTGPVGVDLAAVRRQQARRAFAEPRGPAGDDEDLACDIHVRSSRQRLSQPLSAPITRAVISSTVPVPLMRA